MITKIHTYEFMTEPGNVLHLLKGEPVKDTLMCAEGTDPAKMSGELVIRTMLNKVKKETPDGHLVITHDGMRATKAFVKVDGKFVKVPKHKAAEYFRIIDYWLSGKNAVRSAA